MSVLPGNTTPDTAPGKPQGRLHPLVRPVASCSIALAIGIGLAPFVLKPPEKSAPVPTKSVEITGNDIALAILAPSKKFGLAEGKVTAASAMDAVATATGLVARHLVESGTAVKKGEPVLEISVGKAVQMAPGVEKQQDRAEQSQVRAIREQDELADKITSARDRLAAAEADVAAAKERVDAARELVKSLRAGKAVRSVEAPAARRTRVADAGPDKAALAEAQRTQKDAEAAEQALFTAQDKVRSTEAAAKTATEELNRATSKVAKVEDLYNRKAMEASDVEAARSAAMEAQDKATDANTKAFNAKQDADKLEKRAKSLRAAADKAGQKVAGGLSNVRIFETPDPTATPDTGSGPNVTMAQAAQMVEDALAQGKEAAHTAERLHAEIDNYEAQVKSSQTRVASSTQQLQAAQQRVMDAVPKPKFVPVYAPKDGTVVWMAPLAEEVKVGQPIFGLAEGSLVGRLEDTTGWWRRLTPGSQIPALVPPPVAEGTPAPAGADAGLKGALVTLTLQQITPGKDGKPGVITGGIQVVSPGVPPVQVRPGMKLLASMITADNAPALQVPASCVLDEKNTHYVAVLRETSELGAPKREFSIDWRAVRLGEAKDGRVDVVDGLQPGERVLRTPTEIPGPSSDNPDITAVMQS